MTKRRNILASFLGLAGLSRAAESEDQKALNAPVIMKIQDSVLSFPVTGDGVRAGTVTGVINGTTITNFQFLPVPPPVFQADDLCVVSDIDGDQLFFRVRVTGRFLEAFGDASLPSGIVSGVGGPFSGTYEVTKATGKYSYLVGRKFPCKGIGSNPAKGNAFGTVFVEVYSDALVPEPLP